MIYKMALKAAGLGHTTKSLPLHEKWTHRVTEELYRQGDEERKRSLIVSPFMDRQKANLPQSQVGFMSFLVVHMFTAWVKFHDLTKTSARSWNSSGETKTTGRRRSSQTNRSTRSQPAAAVHVSTPARQSQTAATRTRTSTRSTCTPASTQLRPATRWRRRHRGGTIYCSNGRRLEDAMRYGGLDDDAKTEVEKGKRMDLERGAQRLWSGWARAHCVLVPSRACHL